MSDRLKAIMAWKMGGTTLTPLQRWLEIAADRNAHPTAKRMALEAIEVLGGRQYLTPREPGQDDEERVA